MLRISQIKIPVEDEKTELSDVICSVLKINKNDILSFNIEKRSIEARRKEKLSFVYSINASVKNEKNVLKRIKNKNVSLCSPVNYSEPEEGNMSLDNRPVIIGSGPAGLFCAYLLAKKGYRPVLLERGEALEERRKTVEHFWNTGELKSDSNVQFGEGGAGTFSDGKLNTGINDKAGRIRYVLNTFVKYGAAEDILYDAKPHIGTDVLYDVIRNMREDIIKMGGEVRFSSRVDDISVESGRVSGVVLSDGERVAAEAVVAAIGHSARDTVRMLYDKGLDMQAKSFAVGVRIQHPQSLINEAQYGEDPPERLGAAPYKLTAKMPDGRGVYTFCMCPGGYVVNASSEEGRLAVNGMSYHDRASGAANSALIVTVDPEDFAAYGSEKMPEALNAIAFQRDLEEKAYRAAGSKIPVQRFEDFKEDKASVSNSFEPCVKGQWKYADVRGIFPEFICRDLTGAVEEMGKRIKGFDIPDALLMGVESRTSSPVRILRNEDMQSNIEGFFPCGEGAGYAGGIVSAAVDGLKTAEYIIKKYRPMGEDR